MFCQAGDGWVEIRRQRVFDCSMVRYGLQANLIQILALSM